MYESRGMCAPERCSCSAIARGLSERWTGDMPEAPWRRRASDGNRCIARPRVGINIIMTNTITPFVLFQAHYCTCYACFCLNVAHFPVFGTSLRDECVRTYYGYVYTN